MRLIHLVRLLVLATAALCASMAGAAAKAPDGLMCNLLSHPELTVLTDFRPKFGWIVNDSRRGATQTAFQIVVSSSPEKSQKKLGDFWDSGKVESSQSVNVAYGGRELLPKQKYYWRVRTWDADGNASPFSTTQHFTMAAAPAVGLLSPTNFANRYPIEHTRVGPQKLIHRANGTYFIDFGRDAFGTVEFSVKEVHAGNSIEVRLGEVLAEDGTIDSNPGGSRRFRKMIVPLVAGQHTYTVSIPSDARNSSGAAIKVKEFMADVMPFRYCELVGVTGEFTTRDIRQITAHYRFDDDASDFTSSDTVLNEVWELCKYSIKATSFTGVYIDGDRERIPYEGDAYINQLCHYSVDREYSLARYSTEYLLAHPTWPAEWQMHMPLIAWNDYLYTGNSDLLATHYDDLAAKTLIALERADGLIVEDKTKMTPELKKALHLQGDIHPVVDWPASSKASPAGERDGYDMRPVNTVANAFHYRTLVVMKQIAEALGKKTEATKWQAAADRTKSSFNKTLFDSATHRYIDGEGSAHSALHANMFPLAFGLVSENERSNVVAFIKSRGMACSVYGAQHLLDGLYHAGASDYALSLLVSTNDRSWFHMKEAGSTITMEAWDNKYKENQDWNHAWGAAPANIIPRLLMGIEPIEPGFAKVRICPQMASLRRVGVIFPTIRGPIKLAVSVEKGIWNAAVIIPANMQAELYVPVANAARIQESKKPIQDAKHVKFLRTEQGNSVFEIGGGTYHFTAALR